MGSPFQSVPLTRAAELGGCRPYLLDTLTDNGFLSRKDKLPCYKAVRRKSKQVWGKPLFTSRVVKHWDRLEGL